MIFLIPMVAASVMSLYFWTSDVDLKWKAAASVVTAVSLALQWVPELQVHFIIPLLMQSLVAICLSIYFKMEYF